MGSYRLPAAPLSLKNFQGPEVLRPRLTAGLPLSAFGPKAAVHSSKLDRHRQGVLRCVPFPKTSQTCTARAKYRYTHARNKGEFVAHRRHNSSRARVIGNELKSYQGRADEISPTPLRLMSHARCTKITRKKRGRISCPSRNDHRGPLRLLLSDSNYLRTIRCTPICTAVISFITAGKRAIARNPSRWWCFGSPTFVP